MKKLLKSTSLFIITIVLTFGFNLNVYAADCGELDSSTCRVGDRGVIKVARYTSSSEATTTTKYQYRETNKYAMTNNNTIDANRPSYGTKNLPEGYFYKYYDNITGIYCMDPGNKAGTGIYAQRFLLDSKDQLHIQAMDYAILEILTDGGSGVAQISNWNDYWARTTAVRAVVATFGNEYKTTTMQDLSQYYAILTAINTWLNESSVAYDNLNTALRNAKKENAAIGTLQAKSAFDDHTDYSFEPNSTAMTKAQDYYESALEAATEFVETATDSPEVDADYKIASKTTEVKVEETSQGTKVSRDIVHTIKVSGMPQDPTGKSGEFVINKAIKWADENANYDGLIAEETGIVSVKIGDTIFGEGSSLGFPVESALDVNILSAYDLTEETEIEITVRFTGWKTSKNRNQKTLKCGQSPIKYYIDGYYSTDVESKFGNYVGVIWYAGTSKEQRFISVEKNNGDKNANNETFKSPYETYLIEACSCDDLFEACINSKNINSNECKELEEANCGECTWLEAQCELGNNSACEEFALVCDAKCEATFTTFECCDEQGDLIVSELDDHEVKIEGPEETKLCFVTKVDAQINGTSYSGVSGVNDQNGNSYTLASMKENKYCSVSCKEDYIMTMPTAKLVNAGRYFTFKAKVEGTKTCYTNTINREQYNKDVVDAQVEMVDAYTEYLKWKALSEAPIEYDDKGPLSAHEPCCPTGPKDNRHCRCGSRSSCETNEWREWYVSGAEYIYYYVNSSDKNYDNGTIKVSDRDASASYNKDGHIAGTAKSGCCYARCTNGTSGKKSTLENNIKNGLTNAEERLDRAQKKYEAIIKEYKQCSNWESNINYNPEVYYDYEETYLNNFGLVGEMVESKSDSDSSWYCNSSVSSNGTETKKATITDAKYTKCSNSSSSYSATSINYIYCTTSGCKTAPESISNARYKKLESTVTATYKPATLFYNIYPSGEITINESDDNVAIENGLPVALNTKRGIYKYTVNIENLGEFYDIDSKNNLGRYVGGKTAVVDKDKLEYACSYLVNMPITNEDRLVCDFDDGCKGEDCISDCIGPNCDNICEGVDCVADCIGAGCIYDEDAGSSIVEKTVSLNNLFPTGTNSYNWSKTANDKAKTTVTAIEEKGNKVYDETPILSITLDASSARKIKEYNNDAEFDGGYSNSTISCYKLNGHEEVACYSSFITDLLDDEYGKVVNDNSLIKNDKYRTVSDNNTEYFTPWGGSVSEDNMIGPAWK